MNLTITATASGSLRPRMASFPATVTNGDFTIAGNAIAALVGDGVDEQTTWTFDFTGDPDFSSFSTSLPLASAPLTLTLRPMDPLITSDIFRIEGLGNVSTHEIQGLPPDRLPHTVQLELLNFYSSAEILGVLTANAGRIPMLYADDAIVAFAQLDLTSKVLAFQYAAKFVCGRSAGDVAAPGTYFTAINVHNPTDREIELRKKFAVALPREQSGQVSEFFGAKLGPDEALEIDCPEIRERTDRDADFLKGFVVIESDVELDVVAVYTAAGGTEQVETLHTERVLPRRREVGLADLVPVNPNPQLGPVGFCRRDDQGRLVITVKNQGTADAPASTTMVVFSPGGSFPLPTPPISAGGSVDLPPLSIPGACFDPDCDFTIIVDSNNQVTESDKVNNTASGRCIG
jgi:hypothetical protein